MPQALRRATTARRANGGRSGCTTPSARRPFSEVAIAATGQSRGRGGQAPAVTAEASSALDGAPIRRQVRPAASQARLAIAEPQPRERPAPAAASGRAGESAVACSRVEVYSPSALSVVRERCPVLVQLRLALAYAREPLKHVLREAVDASLVSKKPLWAWSFRVVRRRRVRPLDILVAAWAKAALPPRPPFPQLDKRPLAE